MSGVLAQYKYVFIGLCLLLTATPIQAAEPKISINNNPGYAYFLDNLRKLAAQQASIKQHHFYITRYRPSETAMYMFWREGRQLWILSTRNKTAEHWYAAIFMTGGGRHLDLDKDVVASQEDIGTSTYLVDQPWVNEKLYDAVINGDTVTINN